MEGKSIGPQPILGDISTVAGGPGVGQAISIGQSPYYIAVYGTTLFTSDLVGNVIREVDLSTGAETPVAGDGYGGYSGDGDPANQSELNQPAGIAVDSARDLFVADQLSNRIREIPSKSGFQFGISMTAGNIYTIAGTGAPGYSGDSGPATGAQLNQPEDIALDQSGDIIVADTFNGRIREIAATSHTQFGISMTAGSIYTVGGNGQGGSSAVSGDGDLASSGEIGTPQGVSVDNLGDIFVTEDFNENPAPVREIAATSHTQFGISMTSNNIYTIAGGTQATVCSSAINSVGDGCLATRATLSDPVDAVVGNSGNLFISDYYHDRVREVDATSGTMSTYAGTGSPGYGGSGGPAGKSELALPTGLSFDSSGNLYVSDSTTIRKINLASGVISQVAGNETFNFSGDGALATNAQLGIPSGEAFDALGDLYIADAENNVVREVAATTHSQFGISMSTGNIYTIAGYGFGVGGLYGKGGFGGDGGPATQALLNNPTSVALDQQGDVFVADFGNHRIREISGATGTINTVVGTGSNVFSGNAGSASQASLASPNQVAVDSAGDLFIEDYGASRVLEVPKTNKEQFGLKMVAGEIYTVAGDGGVGYSGDGGPAIQAQFNNPSGIALDASGDLFIVDRYNNRVREVANFDQTTYGVTMTTGNIYTVAGSGGYGFVASGNGGQALSALLGSPDGVAIDRLGDLWISDSNGHDVREVSPSTGIIEALVGTGKEGYTGDNGPAQGAELVSPGALAFDRVGDLFFSDDFLRSGFGYNEVDGRIRKVSISISSPQVPGVPVDVQVSPARTSATVSWLPPLSDGGSQIDQYTISVSPSGKTFNVFGSANQVVISSLILNTTYQFQVTATNSLGSGPPGSASGTPTVIPGSSTGYLIVTSSGQVTAFGGAASDGSIIGGLAQPVVSMAATPDGGGYWLVASDGGVFAFGDAIFLGSSEGTDLFGPTVSLTPTLDGAGYWTVTSIGAVSAFGDATNESGSWWTGGSPVVSIVAI